MPSPKLRECSSIGQDLALAASIARLMLDLPPDERAAALNGPLSDLLPPRTAWRFAMAIYQVKELLRLLQDAEEAWTKAFGQNSHNCEPQR